MDSKHGGVEALGLGVLVLLFTSSATIGRVLSFIHSFIHSFTYSDSFMQAYSIFDHIYPIIPPMIPFLSAEPFLLPNKFSFLLPYLM